MNRTDGYNDQVEDEEYGPEFVIIRNGELEARTDVFPNPPSYVRVVRVVGDAVEEKAYWNNEELGNGFLNGDPEDAAGAMLAAIGSVARGEMPL